MICMSLLAELDSRSHDLQESSTYGRRPLFSNFYAGSFERVLALADELQPGFPALDSMEVAFGAHHLHIYPRQPRIYLSSLPLWIE